MTRWSSSCPPRHGATRSVEPAASPSWTASRRGVSLRGPDGTPARWPPSSTSLPAASTRAGDEAAGNGRSTWPSTVAAACSWRPARLSRRHSGRSTGSTRRGSASSSRAATYRSSPARGPTCAPADASPCCAWRTGSRARACSSCWMRWRHCRPTGPRCTSSGARTSIRRTARGCGRGSPTLTCATGSWRTARSPATLLPPCTPRPTCSCSRAMPRPTAPSTGRRWPPVFPRSAGQPGT